MKKLYSISVLFIFLVLINIQLFSQNNADHDKNYVVQKILMWGAGGQSGITALPTVTTTAPVVTGPTTATSGGTASGYGTISAVGVCWNTAGSPTITDPHTTDLNGATWTSYITGLTPGTLYHVRAYCTDGTGTAYGSDLTFTACSTAVSVPYNEGFEGIGSAGLWPCGYTTNTTSSYVNTYTSIPGSYNRRPHSGTNFAAFYYNSSLTKWVYSAGIPLTGGTQYIFSVWYAGDGYTGWTNFGIGVGSSPVSTAMTTIASVAPAADTVYRKLSGTFTPSVSGTYFIGITETDNGVPYYLSFDDISITLPVPMVYTASTTAQAINGMNALQNSINNQIIKVQIDMTGTLTPLNLTAINFNTTGTTNPAVDITNAKVYYTGTTNAFSTSNLFGTVASPNGAFTVNGSQGMVEGTNYFWLTYDVPATGPVGDYLDAQVLSVTGSGSMGTQVPAITNPAGRNQIDNYCRPQFSTNSLPYGIYITNVSIGTINNTTAYDPDNNFPYAYSWYGNLSTDVEKGVTYTISSSVSSTGNGQAVGIWIDWDNNNVFETGEYTSFPQIPSGGANTVTTNLTIPSNAPLGSHRMRVRNALSTITSSQACALLTYGETEDYSLNVVAAAPMAYTSSTVTQTNTSGVTKPSANTEMIGIQVVTSGSSSPLNASSFTFNTNGSTNASNDITNAKLWFTGISNTFASATQVGSTFNAPNGTFVINGSQVLQPGTNYFWLTYDVPASATTADLLDAECTALTVGTVKIPTVTAPAGSRTIGAGKMAGVYSIPEDYSKISLAIADLNARGISGPVTFNIASGFVDTAVNLTITTTGTVENPILFQRFGASPLPNPVILAGIGTSTTTDGIIKISGGNYITFDGIDLQENAANITTTTQMEWGYALVKPNAADGCQFVTIKNCTVTLNKLNTASVGIYSANHSAASTTTFVVTNANGSNSNNTFFNNTITNSYTGLAIYGYADAAPYSFYDQNNTVNQCNITNFGGSSSTAYGIYNIYQNGLNISNSTINSSGGTNSTSTLYGIFCSTMINSNLTISNNTITVVSAATTSSVYGIAYGNSSSGTTNNVNILNNTVQNCSYTTATSGSMYYIYGTATSNNLVISGNKVIGNTYGTAGTTTGSGVYAIYNGSSAVNSITFSNNLDSGNVLNGTTTYSSYRMYNSVSVNNAIITGNKIKNNTLCGTTATGTMYGLYNSAGTYTCTFANNEVSGNIVPTTSSASVYFLYNSSAAPAMDYINNTVTGNTGTGTGTFYSLYYSASPGIGSTVNINNNTISNQSKTTTTGTGTIYGVYALGSPAGTYNINNNTVTGFTSAAATAFYGVYHSGSPANYLNVNNNKVGNFNAAGAGTIYGIYVSPTTSTIVTVSQDSVYNLTSAGGTIYGIYNYYGNPSYVYKNNVSGLTSTTGTAAVVYGIHANSGTTQNIYNNVVSDLNATASTSIAPAISGIYINTPTYANVYYNTVYLNAVSSATTFGTAGIYASITPVLDMRNNVIVNTSTPGASGGQTVAYRRSSTTITTYASTSNNNCFYAGTPAANKVIFYDGTNLDQTLAAYKTRVIPRDNNSASENPPFVNSTTAPYDLRIQTTIATQLESGAKTISTPVNITDDRIGTARYPNTGYPVGGFTPIAPDMGAYEFGGLNGDNVPPSITYTPLGTGGTTNRSFTNVLITDPTGVNITAGTKPRVYYKRSIDGNVINDNTNATDGWKYAEANGTTSPFDFTIDYSLLNGGTGVTAGQVIQYFVIAQDLALTPNVGANQATFTIAPATVALIAGNAPVTNYLSYTISTNSFAGNINVGTSQTYTSLTGASGIFAALNAGTITGDVTISITSDLTEDGLNQLNALNESGVGGYKIRIVPGDATLKTISGTVLNGMIRLNGVRRVTFDGDNGLNGKYLTFKNTGTAYPTFTFINDAVKDSIKNCIIESANISTTSGTIFFSTTTGLQGNDSNVIANCDIRDRSDITGTPANAVYSSGTTTTLGQYNNFNTIINCNIYNYFYDASSFTAGVYLNTGSSNWTISGNSFYQTAARTVVNGASFIGVLSNSTLQNDINVTGNYFGGSAPLCGGTAMTYTGAGLYNVYGFYLSVGNLAVSNAQGNTIKNIDLTTSPASGSSAFFRGIYAAAGWVNIGNLAGNTIGSGTGTGSITLTANTTVSAYNPVAMIHHTGFGTIMNNTIGSITIAGNSLGSGDLYAGIYWSNTVAGQVYTISNNLIGSLTTANSIQVTNNVNTHSLRGVYIINGAGTQNNITNNTVANLTSFNTSVNLCTVYGMQQNSAVNGNYTYANNTVRNLTNNCNPLSASFGILGLSSTAIGQNIYSQNTISNLNAAGTGAGAQIVGGILAGGASTSALGGIVTRNKIYDIKISGTGSFAPSPLILGINVQGNAAYNVNNNMIMLTNGDLAEMQNNLGSTETFEQVIVKSPPVNMNAIPEQKEEFAINSKYTPDRTINVVGVYADKETWNILPKETSRGNVGQNDNATTNTAIAGVYHTNSSYGPSNYYYNTIYIGGTQPSGSYNSWAFVRTSTGAVSLLNNLLVNARTGGYANQYVIGNQAANPVSGWPSNSSNYNTFIGSNQATIGEWGSGSPASLTQWITASGNDKQSYGTTTSVVNTANLFTNIAACDLTIQSGNTAAWVVSGKGIALNGYNFDYSGDTRVTSISNGCTDIGADEFTATPPANPVAVQVGIPAAGSTTDYILFGRKICSIEWGQGGTSYPASLNVNYYSGVNPPNTGSLGITNGNSYWTIAPTSGTLNGALYNITLYFGENETYTIPSPSANTVLAKYDTFWQTFAAGTGSAQSNVSWNNFSVKVTDLDRFSTFTLTNGEMAVQLVYPANRQYYIPTSPTLVWRKVAGATNYKVELSADSTFATTIVVDSTLTDSTKPVSGLTLNSSYFWRVRAKNVSVIGPTSAVYKFTVGNAPLAPTLIAPLNNSVGQALTPLLDWTDVTDMLTDAVTRQNLGMKDEPEAITYQVQVSTSNLFTTTVIDSTGLTTSQVLVPAGKLSNFNVYYWRVRCSDGISTTPWSVVWNFRTLFSTFALLTPANGATNVPLTTNLTWQTLTGATNYRLQLSTNSGFTAIVKDTVVSATQYSCYSGLLNPAVQYYWRARGIAGSDSSAWASAFNFTTAGWVTVNLTIVPGGFYNSSTGQLNMRDTVKLYLIDTVGGGHLVDSSRAVIDSVTFTAQFKFDNAPDGNYFIYVFHRNHIPIATANMLNLTRLAAVNYNMSDLATKTFGSNVIQVSTSPVVWGMIPGDANQDQYVDALDQLIWINQNGLDGYLSADFNGDIYVDALDQLLWITYNGNSSALPWYPSLPATDPLLKTKGNTNGTTRTVIINQGSDKIKSNDSKINQQNNLKK